MRKGSELKKGNERTVEVCLPWESKIKRKLSLWCQPWKGSSTVSSLEQLELRVSLIRISLSLLEENQKGPYDFFLQGEVTCWINLFTQVLGIRTHRYNFLLFEWKLDWNMHERLNVWFMGRRERKKASQYHWDRGIWWIDFYIKSHLNYWGSVYLTPNMNQWSVKQFYHPIWPVNAETLSPPHQWEHRWLFLRR